MHVQEAIRTRRSVRKFRQDPVDPALLEKLVDCARLAPSGANLQPLCYKIVSDRPLVAEVEKQIKWAAYLYPDYVPKNGEKPVAYIAICVDTRIKQSGWDVDLGLAGATLLLEATEMGLGTCMLGAINRPEISRILGISEPYKLLDLVALGYPAEKPVAVAMQDGNVKYYVKDGVLQVPKRSLSDVLL